MVSYSSKRHSSQQSYYDKSHRRASLLALPIGYKLLQQYKTLHEKKGQRDAFTDGECKTIDCIAKKIKENSNEIEPTISTKMRDAFLETVNEYTVSGEMAERVEGELSQQAVSGKPDIVFRVPPTEDQEKGRLLMITEVSVDENGGEKKIGQALDYCQLVEKPNAERVFVFGIFHLDRENKEVRRITQEVFLYCHHEQQDLRKHGFLWREIYEIGDGMDESAVVKKSCEGLLRSIRCAVQVPKLLEEAKGKQWDVCSDNVAMDEKYVYKIFDNRFHPTQRKPVHWLDKEKNPCLEGLDVTELVKFDEGRGRYDLLGHSEKVLEESPRKKRRTGVKTTTRVPSDVTPYLLGSALVIRYNKIEGSHFASDAKNFQDIAKALVKLHAQGLVHGDIRGFNMVFPEGENGVSRLIDFDFTGVAEVDRYPRGYAQFLPDVFGRRGGQGGEHLKQINDWEDLSGVMSQYRGDGVGWEELLDTVAEGQPLAILDSLQRFMDSDNSTTISMSRRTRKNLENEPLFSRAHNLKQ